MERLHQNKDWLYEKYHTEKCSTREIAKLANVSRTIICRWMKKFDIKARTSSEGIRLSISEGKTVFHPVSGKEHYMYGKKIPDEVKEKISDALKGNNNWRYKKTGRLPVRHSSGYILIHCEEHPRAEHDGKVFEHRIVMEKHIGRYLTEKEVVHHINNNKSDNRIENLYLFATQKDHAYFHRMEYFKKPVPLQYSYNH